MSVIIISHHDDAHIPFVSRHLEPHPITIDFQDIVDTGNVSLAVNNGRSSVFLKNKRVENVTGVWVRRPRQITKSVRIPVSSQHLAYSQSALREFTDIFFTLWPNATWVSDYYAILRAESKPLQQTIAGQLGFAIPRTLYTTDSERARHFINSYAPVVVKTLAKQLPLIKEGRGTSFYTRTITAADDIRLDSLHLAPAIFQQLIDPREEFRITVVGEKVFAARIHSSSPVPGIRDWRISQHYGGVVIERCTLPLDIKEKCIRLTKQLGLSFGAIDIIKDGHGVFWFLEINPNGQWAFVEEATGQPIGKAIARLLTKPPSTERRTKANH